MVCLLLFEQLRFAIISDTVKRVSWPFVLFDQTLRFKLFARFSDITRRISNVFSNVVCGKPHFMFREKPQHGCSYLSHRWPKSLPKSVVGIHITPTIGSKLLGYSVIGVTNKRITQITGFPVITSDSSYIPHGNDCRCKARVTKYHNGPFGPAVVPEPMSRNYHDRTETDARNRHKDEGFKTRQRRRGRHWRQLRGIAMRAQAGGGE